MAVNIVTGMTGVAHITSDDDRAKNASIFGVGKYVLDYGKKFETSILSNNQIRVRDGMCMNQGTQMGIEPSDYEDVTIENGVSGSNRNDLIVMRYERNADTAIEKASLVVIKGTSGITATDPSYNLGNILDGGDLIDDMPLFRVKIESLSIMAVEPLFVVFDYSHRKALAGLSNVDNTSDEDKTVNIAKKLSNTSAIGSATRPVYFNNKGVPVAGTYTLGAACAKGVSTSVTSGDSNLVTGDAVSTAISTATNYEEGTFTPVFYNGSTKVKTGAIEASYKKVGNLVYIFISEMWNGSFPKITSIKGLPFASSSTGNIGKNVLNGCQLYSNISGTDSNEYIDSYISGTEMTVSLSGKSSVNAAVLSVCGIYKIS